MLKEKTIFVAAAVLALICGCSTSEVLQTPVGPEPLAGRTSDLDGTLRVFSAIERENTVGFEFPSEQRADYYICDAHGNEIRESLR